MRLDLVQDLKIAMERFLILFIDKLNGSSNGVVERIITSEGTVMLENLFYFCCFKKFFGLSKSIYMDQDQRTSVVLELRKGEWDIKSVSTNKSIFAKDFPLLQDELKRRYKPSKEYSKHIVSFIIYRKELVYLLIGIVVNESKQNQSFYLRGFEFSVGVNNTDNALLWREQKLIYKQHYLDYLTIRKQSGATLSIQEYIASLNFQVKSFQTNFKKYLGTTMYDYLIQDRLLEALALLMFSNYSVTEIAYKCGYENYRTFHKAFTKDQNYLPLYYRSLKN